MKKVQSSSVRQQARIFGLFQKRFEGDNSLLSLSRLRFEEAGLAPEFHAGTPEELEVLLSYSPYPDVHAMVHLPREINLLEENGQKLVLDFATRFAGRVSGLVVHDQRESASHLDDYITSLLRIDDELEKIRNSPLLFVEYAVGLNPEEFIRIFNLTRDAEHISACIDTGHIGLRQASESFLARNPQGDIYSMSPGDPQLKELIWEIDEAICSALPFVLDVINALIRLGKPLHFHLHDGHPLYTLSPYGLSDHLSFLDDIALPFEHRGKHSMDLMFGPHGLREIITASLDFPGNNTASYTLEIHPDGERQSLGNASHLFGHWQDLANAERTNRWLAVLKQNHKLLLEVIQQSHNQSLR